MKKNAVFAGLGDFYNNNNNSTGFSALHFIYNNIVDLQTKLKSDWIINPAMIDSTADKTTIITKLTEIINSPSTDEDWVLFYYTGHASKYFLTQPDRSVTTKTFCVTYSKELTFNFLPTIEEFLSEINYDDVIRLFRKKIPNGHLITILDCCFAFGLIENFSLQQDFHTIIAASSPDDSAFYDDNSLFFKAFKQSWDLPFEQLQTGIENIMLSMQSPSVCEIQAAEKFKTSSLTSNT